MHCKVNFVTFVVTTKLRLYSFYYVHVCIYIIIPISFRNPSAVLQCLSQIGLQEIAVPEADSWPVPVILCKEYAYADIITGEHTDKSLAYIKF